MDIFGWLGIAVGDAIRPWHARNTPRSIFTIKLLGSVVCYYSILFSCRNETASNLRHGEHECRSATNCLIWKDGERRNDHSERNSADANESCHADQVTGKRTRASQNYHYSHSSNFRDRPDSRKGIDQWRRITRWRIGTNQRRHTAATSTAGQYWNGDIVRKSQHEYWSYFQRAVGTLDARARQCWCAGRRRCQASAGSSFAAGEKRDVPRALLCFEICTTGQACWVRVVRWQWYSNHGFCTGHW